jgi:Ca2+/H+ antiporter
LAGGFKHKTQTFHTGGARIQATMMTLATIALILPAAFHWLVGPQGRAAEADLRYRYLWKSQDRPFGIPPASDWHSYSSF